MYTLLHNYFYYRTKHFLNMHTLRNLSNNQVINGGSPIFAIRKFSKNGQAIAAPSIFNFDLEFDDIGDFIPAKGIFLFFNRGGILVFSFLKTK